MARQTIAEQLERARLAIRAIETDPELAERLADLGYADPRIDEGKSLYAAALERRGDSHSAHGDQLGATDAVEALRDSVAAQVSALTQMARTVFAGNDDALETLGLRMGERATPEVAASADGAPRQPSRSQAAFLDRARTLYDGALADSTLLSALSEVGYTEARLTSERAEVTALEDADVAQEGNKASAKARTANQKDALEALDDWLDRLRGVARAGLRDRRDLLEKLGA